MTRFRFVCSMAKHKKLIIRKSLAPVMTEQELNHLVTLQRDFIQDYVENKGQMDTSSWLQKILKENLPGLSEEQHAQIGNQILDTLNQCEADRKSLNEALSNGIDAPRWFARQMLEQTKDMAPEAAADYIHSVFSPVDESNKVLFDQVVMQGSLLEQNIELKSQFSGCNSVVACFNHEAEHKNSPYRARLLEGESSTAPVVEIIDAAGRTVEQYEVQYNELEHALKIVNDENKQSTVEKLDIPAWNVLGHVSDEALNKGADYLTRILGQKVDKEQVKLAVEKIADPKQIAELLQYEFELNLNEVKEQIKNQALDAAVEIIAQKTEVKVEREIVAQVLKAVSSPDNADAVSESLEDLVLDTSIEVISNKTGTKVEHKVADKLLNTANKLSQAVDVSGLYGEEALVDNAKETLTDVTGQDIYKNLVREVTVLKKPKKPADSMRKQADELFMKNGAEVLKKATGYKFDHEVVRMAVKAAKDPEKFAEGVKDQLKKQTIKVTKKVTDKMLDHGADLLTKVTGYKVGRDDVGRVVDIIKDPDKAADSFKDYVQQQSEEFLQKQLEKILFKSDATSSVNGSGTILGDLLGGIMDECLPKIPWGEPLDRDGLPNLKNGWNEALLKQRVLDLAPNIIGNSMLRTGMMGNIMDLVERVLGKSVLDNGTSETIKNLLNNNDVLGLKSVGAAALKVGVEKGLITCLDKTASVPAMAVSSSIGVDISKALVDYDRKKITQQGLIATISSCVFSAVSTMKKSGNGGDCVWNPTIDIIGYIIGLIIGRLVDNYIKKTIKTLSDKICQGVVSACKKVCSVTKDALVVTGRTVVKAAGAVCSGVASAARSVGNAISSAWDTICSWF